MITPNFWVGKEIEHSCFYGLDTLFCGDPETFVELIGSKVYNSVSHIYIRSEYIPTALPKIIRIEVQSGKKITLELAAHKYHEYAKAVDTIRLLYPGNFCLMLYIEIPGPTIGNLAIRIQSVEKRAVQGLDKDPPASVFTITNSVFCSKQFQTKPEEYANDIPGEEWLKTNGRRRSLTPTTF